MRVVCVASGGGEPTGWRRAGETNVSEVWMGVGVAYVLQFRLDRAGRDGDSPAFSCPLFPPPSSCLF